MSNTKYIPINNFQCLKCGAVLVSLSVHDFKACRCGNFVDGGFAYVRRGGNFADMKNLPLYWKKDTAK